MPKNFGTNSKAAEARARKDAVKQANEKEKQQRLEDEYWRDDDKHIQKKQQRKEERDQKEHEKLQRKQEIQKLLEQEENTIIASKSKKAPSVAPKKVTQAEIQQRQEAAAVAAVANSTNAKVQPKVINDEDIPIEENVNRLKIDGSSARTIDEAIHVLSSSQIAGDSHPEKRMKAAFETFEKENLPRLKEEHPSLRLSQLKQLLKKEWMKSPDNPFNKPTKAFNQGNSLSQNAPNDDDSDNDDN